MISLWVLCVIQSGQGWKAQLALTRTLDAVQVEAPPMFPPTFLYTQSWEDPRPDMQV